MRLSTNLRRGLILLLLLSVLLFAGFLWYRPLLNIGAGYAAKHACSCHFLQGRELAEIREHDLNFSVLGIVSLSKVDNEIRSNFFGLVPRRAVFRPGVGCTLINEENKPLVAVEAGAAAGAEMNDEIADVVSGAPPLKCALDYGMLPVAGGGARAIVVLQDSAVIAESYAPGYDASSRLLGWSMTKTLTGLIVGHHLVNHTADTTRGRPDFAALTARNGLFPTVWTDSARRQITVNDLLQMNSGLAWNESYGALSDATIMLHEHADMAGYASAAPALRPRASEWVYSSGTTNILAGLVDREAGDGSFRRYCRDLFGPVAPSLLIEPSQAGLPVGSSYGWATARDWAKLGQLMLQDGVWNGDTLVPPGWIAWLRRPAPNAEGVYGGQLWLPGPDTPSLPEDAYMMRGFQDQRVFVVPSLSLVIARLGHNDDKTADFDGLVRRVIDALPPDGRCE